MTPDEFSSLSPQEQADIWTSLGIDDRRAIREAQNAARQVQRTPPKSQSEAAALGESDLVYVSVSLDIPDKEPYEGKATLKQKHRIWELGYRDQSIIDSLGKRQASAVIDQLCRVYRKEISRRSFRRYVLWAMILLVGSLAVLMFSDDDDLRSSFPVLGFLASATLLLLGFIQLARSRRGS